MAISSVLGSSALLPAGLGFRNKIINGDMRIDQRNAGAAINPATSAYTVDRWTYFQSQTNKFSFQQNQSAVTPPAGFSSYAGFTSLGAYSVVATDQFLFTQNIEGQNVADFAWGTASAKPVVLSFWVRSSLTGTFGGSIQNSAANRCFPFSYSISLANTWEYKTVYIVGDSSGTWLTTNGVGAQVRFSLATGTTYSETAGAWTASSFITSVTGAVSVAGTSGATFYVTGVQLEQNLQPTPFEQRPIGVELALCQRYYYLHATGVGVPIANGSYYQTSTFFGMLHFPTTMRTAPSLSYSSVANSYRIFRLGAPETFTNLYTQSLTENSYTLYTSGLSTTAGTAGWMETAVLSSAFVAFQAEL